MFMVVGLAAWLLVAVLLGLCVGGSIHHAEGGEESMSADTGRDQVARPGAVAVPQHADADAAAAA